MQLRHKDQESYKYFVDTYLICILCHGKTKNIKYSSPSEVFSTSDEAMVMWFLENSWERWEDMKKNDNKKRSDIDTKFTVPGDKGGSKKFGGWNELEKQRYNELFDEIAEERESELVLAFDSYYQSKQDKNAKHKKKNDQTASTARATKSVRNGLAALNKKANTAGSVKSASGSSKMSSTHVSTSGSTNMGQLEQAMPPLAINIPPPVYGQQPTMYYQHGVDKENHGTEVHGV